MEKRTVKDIQLTGKRVLVRVDYNVPMNDKGEITDVIRIEASLPTLHYLLDQGASARKPRLQPLSCGMGISCCWKTSGSIRKKKKMILILPRNWRLWGMCT